MINATTTIIRSVFGIFLLIFLSIGCGGAGGTETGNPTITTTGESGEGDGGTTANPGTDDASDSDAESADECDDDASTVTTDDDCGTSAGIVTLIKGEDAELDAGSNYVSFDNAEDFTEFWNGLFDDVDFTDDVPEIPYVNFDSEIVVAVVTGRGYDIDISGYEIGDGALLITVVETSPGEGCFVTDSFVNPFQIVVIPITGMVVEFMVESGAEDCE